MAKIIKEGEDWELQLKSEVFEFIKSTFTLEIYNDHLRLDGFVDEFQGDYKKFMENNKRCLDAFNSDEINLYYYLYQNIEKGKVNIVLTETGGYNKSEAITFYFNLKGEFIIY
jgi:hypothetical protein